MTTQSHTYKHDDDLKVPSESVLTAEQKEKLASWRALCEFLGTSPGIDQTKEGPA